MFLHLGGDRAIAVKDILVIGDCNSLKSRSGKRSDINREFLDNKKKTGNVIDVSDKEPKSFVVAGDMIYLSSISSLTLKRRAAMIFDSDSRI